MDEKFPKNYSGRARDSLSTTEENQPKPPAKPPGHSRKMVLLIFGASFVLQCIAFASKRFLYPVQITDNFNTQKLYKILIFGAKEHLSQRLDVLHQVDGVWRHEFSCGDQIKMAVSVGESSADFVGQNAVVFNMDEPAVIRDLQMLVSMPSSPSQAWVYYGQEPAVRMRWLLPYDGSLPLHGVWSFHGDSEVLMRYGNFVRGEPATTVTKSTDEWLRGKSKLVAWMARNCYSTFWPRAAYVESLQKHITVDIFGRCGNMVCPFEPLSKCSKVLKRYKFYLALESAECDDYATEKLWQTAYMNEIVPVVYGAQRDFYVKEAPPDSFIYAGDFNTTEDLAQYLLYLDVNPHLYVKFFEWRYKGHIEVPKRIGEALPAGPFCSLLPLIHKVQRGELNKRPISEYPYYNSCKNLRGRDARFRPRTRRHLRHWKPKY